MIKVIADKPEEKSKLRGAFIKFKKAISNPKKNSDNPFTKSRYVDLAAVLEVIARGEKASGLAFTQDVGTNKAKELSCQSILMGSVGEIVSSPLTVPVVADKHIAKDKSGNVLYDRNGAAIMVSNKRGSQEYGSAETYLRRYSAQSLCGFARKDEDDDGNASTPRNQSSSQGRRQYHDNGEGMKGRQASSGQKRFATNLARRAKGCVLTGRQKDTCDWVLDTKRSSQGDMYLWSKAIDILQKVDTSKKKPQNSASGKSSNPQHTTGKPPHENQQSLFDNNK